MKRALIITYYWPPTGGSGVQRWVKFAKLLPSLGWQPVMYTPENPEQIAVDESLLADIPAEAEIIKTHITEPYEMARRILGGSVTQKGSGVNPVNGQQKTFKQRLALAIRGNFFVPDPRVWWVRPSVKFLKKYLEEHPVDVIVTTGPPQSMHLTGLRLHRELGIPWVADFRDPWTKIFYFKHLGLGKRATRMHHQMEKAVLDGATAVVAVSPLVQAEFQAMTKTPVRLITNGYDEDDFPENGGETKQNRPEMPCPPVSEPGDKAKSAENAASFRIVHTGLFASDGNPLELWSALAKLSEAGFDFELRLAGKVDPEISEAIKAAGLEKQLNLLGYLGHKDSVAELKAADLLILPLRCEPEYRSVLPGKIFEYLAARKPVLGIGQEDGAAAQLLRETGAGIMVDWPKGKQMADFIGRVQRGEFTPEGRGVEEYSRRNRAAAMAALFESII